MKKTAAFDAIKNVIKKVTKSKGEASSAAPTNLFKDTSSLEQNVAASEARSNEHVLKMRDKIDAESPVVSSPPKALPSKMSTAAKVGAGAVGTAGAVGLYHAGKSSGKTEPQGFDDPYFKERDKRRSLQKTAFVGGAMRSVEKHLGAPGKVSSLEHFAADTVQGTGQDKIREKQKERHDLQKVAKEILKRDSAYADAHQKVVGTAPMLNTSGIDAEYERAAMFGTPAAASKAVVKNWEDVRKLNDDVTLAANRQRVESGIGARIGLLGGAGLGLVSAAKSKNPSGLKTAVQGIAGGVVGAGMGKAIGSVPGYKAHQVAKARLAQEEHDYNTNTRTLALLRQLPGSRYEDLA